ncbi:MAG: hypothetical protein LBI72_12475 [Flavobacteriaceae bacterium]|jgi:flagellar hook protein FlgE|nr:hypothetical protein [Flavobacteriaceae bacterium]
MKNKTLYIQKVVTVIAFVFMSLFSIQTKAQEYVTLKGKITDATGKQVPQTIVSILEKGNWETTGSNNHTIMDRNGKFKIKVKKGSTVLFYPGSAYLSLKKSNITKNTKINVILQQRDSKQLNPNPEIFNITPKKYTITGIVCDADTKKPIEMVTISERWIYNEEYASRHTVTDKEGKFVFTVHQGNQLNIEGYYHQNYDLKNIKGNTNVLIELKRKPDSEIF